MTRRCYDIKENLDCLSLYNGECLMMTVCHRRKVYAGKGRIKSEPKYGSPPNRSRK